MKKLVALCVALGALVLGALFLGASCSSRERAGGADRQDAATTRARGDVLTIYSSLPRHGAQRERTEAIERGIELALDQHDGSVGQLEVRYRPLDDATGQRNRWDPSATWDNARRAAADPSTIGYIGELDSGASAISIPVLNKAVIPQVSPASTAISLTADPRGGVQATPAKYYPTGRRTFARVVPNDTVQGAALVRLMGDRDCSEVAILRQDTLYGSDLAASIEAAAKRSNLSARIYRIAGDERAAQRAAVDQLGDDRPDCVVYAGSASPAAVRLFRELYLALPDIQLFGGSALAAARFIDPDEKGIPAGVASVTTITHPATPPRTRSAGRRRFERALGGDGLGSEEDGRDTDLDAVYGYEAMSLLLDSIRRAGRQRRDRQAVVDALFDTRNRRSAIGTYSIDRNGDTTIDRYGAYSIRKGRLAFEQTLSGDRLRSSAAR